MSRLFPATGAGLLHSQEITFCPWTRCFASTHRLYLQQIISPTGWLSSTDYLQQIISSTDYLQQINYLQQIISSKDYLQQIIFNGFFQRREGLKGQDMGIGGFLVCSSCVFFFALPRLMLIWTEVKVGRLCQFAAFCWFSLPGFDARQPWLNVCLPVFPTKLTATVSSSILTLLLLWANVAPKRFHYVVYFWKCSIEAGQRCKNPLQVPDIKTTSSRSRREH